MIPASIRRLLHVNKRIELLTETETAADVNKLMAANQTTRDAILALCTGRKMSSSTKKAPYLSNPQLSCIQASSSCDWDQTRNRYWQGALVHVDFSPNEIEVIEKVAIRLQKNSRLSRHNTQRRRLRELLKDFAPSNILCLASEVRRRLSSRDEASIIAFLQDAKAGEIADVPRIKSLAAARPRRDQKVSLSQMMRQREAGCQSNRGWREASKAVTYRTKNQLMDAMGPVSGWKGASSDVHVVAWAPDGQSFGAGAVAVDDPDSMQYNRPNNLLYGDLLKGTICELGEHTMDRKRTESGANSSHAMFVSQDPKLYTTVTSVAFSTEGTLMYSAGYDGTICAWHTRSRDDPPVLRSKLNAGAKIDLMTVNRRHHGIIAAAAKVPDSKAVRLLSINEESPFDFTKHSFHSSQAVSRADLKILPTALKFEPSYGNLLLAGFGANVQDRGYDITGDVCLWDVETRTQIQIHGGRRNVFDVEFNPNRSSMPLFAIGCVAGGSVNRGTRSLLRLYDENGAKKCWCPLEIECEALDINDICWNPHDEYLIAAGCTSGRAYVWDVRWPNDPIRTLIHGTSVMPLPVGLPHEVTDTGVRFLAWGGNATRLYSGSSDGIVKVWDVTRSEEDAFVKDLIHLNSGIMSGAFSPDMSKLIVGEVDGSINVLEVGRNDCQIKNTEKLRYIPYERDEESRDSTLDIPTERSNDDANSGIAEGNLLLQTQQIKRIPAGGLPICQVVQGPQYSGPFDRSMDAPLLRQKALEFQFSLFAKQDLQCDIADCKAVVKITDEDVGDSGRSQDRMPDELRRQWEAIDIEKSLHHGKLRCTFCRRPARPLALDSQAERRLCERCSFACFRCGTSSPVASVTTTFICHFCTGIWDMGSLGYECVQQPAIASASPQRIPTLEKFGSEVRSERLEDADASFGDEMNALTDYYFSLATERPESPPL